MDIHRVTPGSPVDLSSIDTRGTPGFDGGKEEARRALADLTARLAELQTLLFAQGRHRLLVVLQALDTGGKDGTIRAVFSPVNPQGVKVASFTRPTPIELAHDYLWRVHSEVPGNGEIVVFNRSHYEDVLVVRVHGLVPEEVWARRYGHINAFERLLADEGTTIVKFYLHISKDEQKERFQERLDEPHKHWKFNPADIEVRQRWNDFQTASEQAIARCSTAHAPWFVIPANRNWYRNACIARIVRKTIEATNPEWPALDDDMSGIVIE